MDVKPRYKLHHSTVLDADPDTVWAEVRDVMKLVKIVFADMAESVEWVDGGRVEVVPSRYNFSLLPGHDLVQQQIAGRNEVERSVTYRTVARALCIMDYVATYRVRAVTNDPTRSYMEWTRDIQVADDAAPEVVEAIFGMMANQINAVRDYFAGPSA
ncbi:SRPBCC family protein [Actinophytocola glycyrrhizae]|uniref:SRPBCC family protein n=1 Tax=Actinophytocola glycyrrhizae TaxID=2044873 RepID=A0ABV9S5Z2_9PSEU